MNSRDKFWDVATGYENPSTPQTDTNTHTYAHSFCLTSLTPPLSVNYWTPREQHIPQPCAVSLFKIAPHTVYAAQKLFMPNQIQHCVYTICLPVLCWPEEKRHQITAFCWDQVHHCFNSNHQHQKVAFLFEEIWVNSGIEIKYHEKCLCVKKVKCNEIGLIKAMTVEEQY